MLVVDEFAFRATHLEEAPMHFDFAIIPCEEIGNDIGTLAYIVFELSSGSYTKWSTHFF